MFQKRTGPFVILSYLCFDSYNLHENFQKYIGGVACCEYGLNVYDSLTILCTIDFPTCQTDSTDSNYFMDCFAGQSFLFQFVTLAFLL